VNGSVSIALDDMTFEKKTWMPPSKTEAVFS